MFVNFSGSLRPAPPFEVAGQPVLRPAPSL